MTQTENRPFMNAREDDAFRFLGFPTSVRSTAETTQGAFGLIESWEMPQGFASPYHTHSREDESFYVLDGEFAIVCGGKWMKAGPGTFVYGPRGIPHGFQVISSRPGRLLLMATPGGFERFVLGQATPLDGPPSPPDMDKLMMLAEKYGIEIHGPLPEMPAELQADASLPSGLKELNYRWIQAFNDRDWETERALRSPDFKAYLSGMKEPMDFEAWSGFMTAFTTAFPDSRITIESCIAEGDKVLTRWTLTGTHRGEFQGIPPSDRAVKFSGLELNHVSNGKLTEHWANFDNLALLQQVGAIPA